MVYTEKQIEQEMRRHGFKITSQRRAVLNAIIGSQEHLTPAALYEKVKLENKDVGLVTIYRTIEILTGLGFICEMHLGGSCRSYTIRRPSEHHHHLICSDCGKVIDFTNCNLDGLANRLAQENHFKINSHLLEFLGQCNQCRHNYVNKNRVESKERVGV